MVYQYVGHLKLSSVIFLIPSRNTIGYQFCYLISTSPDNCNKKQVLVSVDVLIIHSKMYGSLEDGNSRLKILSTMLLMLAHR